MMNQREAVFQAVVTVVGEINGAVSLTPHQKEQVHSLVVRAFLDGEVELKGERTSDWVKKYVPGLVNNWCRKDPRLNGNTTYKAKNPGSRAGSGDETLRALKGLLAITTKADDREAIEAAIATRMEEIKPKVEIKIEALPPHLRHLAVR